MKKEEKKFDLVIDTDEDGEYCVVPLNGKYKRIAKIDIEDYESISKYRWHANKHYRTYYAYHNTSKPKNTSIRMHRCILKINDPKISIDHKNGNGLDNRRKNLRVCTHRENIINQRKFTGTSRYKGVCWKQKEKEWHSRVSPYSIQKMLGRYQKNIINGTDYGEMAAARAYDRAAAIIFREYARLNFPEQKGEIMSYVMCSKEVQKAKHMINNLRDYNSKELSEVLLNTK
ncbi:MAG: HNH endonuclease, partial [Planctomycetota bacterium]